MVSEKKTTYWIVILPSCQCLGCEEVVFRQFKYSIIFLSLGIIGGLESWRILASLWKEKCEMDILNKGVDAEQLRVFHILDSLRNNSSGEKEEETLQRIILKHFEGESYQKGRITTNIAEAICLFLLSYSFS
jgi:hypothetical protein